MSWTELNEGMPYGGMPHDAILQKLEETDPYVATGYGGWRDLDDSNGFTGELHKDYMVGEILDRRPDQGFLESDRPRRNPQVSREALNLRLNGTRGTDSSMPRHPDLFLGFLDKDPRGVDGLPRFEKMRDQMAHRVRQLEVRMGDSAGHGGGPGSAPEQVAERPWTGPAFEKARAEMHRQIRKRLKVFSPSKDGRASGRNVVNDYDATRGLMQTRETVVDDGDEHWGEQSAVGWSRDRSTVRDDARPRGLDSFTNRRDSARGQGARLAHRSTNTDQLQVARYGRSVHGRSKRKGREAVHAERSLEQQQQNLVTARNARSTAGQGREALARAMSESAQSSRARNSRDAENATGIRVTGATDKTDTNRSSRHVAESDPAVAYYQAVATQARRPQEHGRAAVSTRGLAAGVQHELSGASQQTVWKGDATRLLVDLATNMAHSTRSLATNLTDEEGRVASSRVAYEAYADGARPSPAADVSSERAAAYSRGRNMLPGDNAASGGGFDTTRRQVSAKVHQAAAARGLEVQNYTGATPVEGGSLAKSNLSTVSGIAGGQTIVASAAAGHLKQATATQKRPELLGFTQMNAHTHTDDHAFGLQVDERTDESSHAPSRRIGSKSLRADRVVHRYGDRVGTDGLSDARAISVEA